MSISRDETLSYNVGSNNLCGNVCDDGLKLNHHWLNVLSRVWWDPVNMIGIHSANVALMLARVADCGQHQGNIG